MDKWWETTTGALHRTIFASVVGLGALALSLVLWAASFPLVTWKLSSWLPAKLAKLKVIGGGITYWQHRHE